MNHLSSARPAPSALLAAVMLMVTLGIRVTTAEAAPDTNGLAVAAFGSQNLLFGTDSTGDIEQWTDSSSGWSPAVTLNATNGVAETAPAAAVLDAGKQLGVFYLATDGAMEESLEGPGGPWSAPFVPHGSSGTGDSAPAATAFGSGSGQDVLFQAPDGGLEEAAYAGTWSDSEVAGTAGTMASAPGVTANSAGTDLDVFYENASGGLDEITDSSSGGWSAVTAIAATSGTMASAPAVLVDAGIVYVFYENTAGGLDELSLVGASWSAPAAVVGTDGDVAATPAADIYPAGQLDVLYRTPAGGIDQSALGSSGAWSQSQAVAPPQPVTPAPVQSPPSTTTIAPAPTRTKTRARPRVNVTVRLRWTYNRHGPKRTHLRVAGIAHFPKDARLAVSCHGAGCGRLKLHARRAGLPRLWRKLERHAFEPGDRITITITRRGHLRETGTLLVRPRAAPEFVSGAAAKGTPRKTEKKTRPKKKKR